MRNGKNAGQRKSAQHKFTHTASQAESTRAVLWLAGPAPDAVSALVAFLRAFAAMTEAEQRALLEKLQRQ